MLHPVHDRWVCRIYIHMYIYIYICINTHSHIYIYTRTLTHTHTHTHTHIYIYIYIYIYYVPTYALIYIFNEYPFIWQVWTLRADQVTFISWHAVAYGAKRRMDVKINYQTIQNVEASRNLWHAWRGNCLATDT